MNIDSVLYVFILYLVCQKLCLDIIGIPKIYMTRVIAVGNIYQHTYSQVIFQSLFPDMAIYTVKRIGWWFLQIKSMSQYRLTLLVDAGGGIWTHGPLRDEVSLPHGSEHRAHGLTPLAMLGNSRVCITFEWTEIYILSIRLDIRKCLVSKGLIVRHTQLPVENWPIRVKIPWNFALHC